LSSLFLNWFTDLASNDFLSSLPAPERMLNENFGGSLFRQLHAVSSQLILTRRELKNWSRSTACILS